MATPNLVMGYMGSATIGAQSYFMSGSSLNPNQAVDAPDVVGGHYMRRGWNYGKVDISGNVSGPLHELAGGATGLWAYAFDRTADGDHLTNTVAVDIAFYKGGGWSFPAVVLNKLDISATAGEVINFTADFAGKKVDANSTTLPASSFTGPPVPVTCSKLMTWDRATFSVAGLTNPNMQSLTFSLNNNVQKPYAITDTLDNTQGLYPVDLPCGVREITGSISMYADQLIADVMGGVTPGGGSKAGANAWIDYDATAHQAVTFQVSTAGTPGDIIDVTFESVFHRPTGAGQTNLTIYTIAFTGVCDSV